MAESKMNKLEQAARQALDALDGLVVYDYNGEPDNGCDVAGAEAITALREALAEQSKLTEDNISHRKLEQEPVAWKQTIRALTDQCAALIQERDELQKQVWRYEKHGVTCQTYRHKVESSCAECNENEIYAAPVRTKDLTDDEIAKAIAPFQHEFIVTGRTTMNFARAVIAKDRELNKCQH